MDEELFKRMQEAAARFNSGESDFEEIVTPVGPAHLVRDATDPRGFRLDFVGEGSKHTVPIQEYPPAPRRHPGYPAPLPFLADCRAIVNTLDQSVSWIDPAEPEAALEQLVRDMVEDGWTPADGTDEGLAFEREGAVRTLRVSTEFGVPRLVLVERQAPVAGG